MTAEALVNEAQDLMDRGKDSRAADVLLTAAIECKDASLAGRIHDMGTAGLERAKWYRKGTWKEVVRVSSTRAEATA
ncbi:MAG: hypothetical protein ACTHNU_18070 [Gaiellales bacterium]|jgi:hypothetical protein